MFVIKEFVMRRFLSGETILSVHAHANTGTPTHKYIDYIKIDTQPRQTTDLKQRLTAAWRGKYGRSLVLEKEMSRFVYVCFIFVYGLIL